MKIVFMGTPDFAVPSLEILVKNDYEIVGVVTATDKPAGRGNKMQVPPVKKFALENNLKVLQPEKLKSPEFVAQLQSLDADLFVVVAFRMLPDVVWKMPPKGTFNLHGSLLPQYRGAAPINWAVINGEKETGATTFFIDKEIDTGNVIFYDKIPIGFDTTAGELHDEMMVTGSRLVLKTVKAIEKEKYRLIKQSEIIKENTKLKPAPKIHKDTCKINWKHDSFTVHNHIRGLSPFPGAWTEFKDITSGEVVQVKIFKSSMVMEKEGTAPGEMKSDQKTYLHVGTGNGSISVLSIQMPGKKRLAIEDFLRGHQVEKYKIIPHSF